MRGSPQLFQTTLSTAQQYSTHRWCSRNFSFDELCSVGQFVLWSPLGLADREGARTRVTEPPELRRQRSSNSLFARSLAANYWMGLMLRSTWLTFRTTTCCSPNSTTVLVASHRASASRRPVAVTFLSTGLLSRTALATAGQAAGCIRSCGSDKVTQIIYWWLGQQDWSHFHSTWVPESGCVSHHRLHHSNDDMKSCIVRPEWID